MFLAEQALFPIMLGSCNPNMDLVRHRQNRTVSLSSLERQMLLLLKVGRQYYKLLNNNLRSMFRVSFLKKEKEKLHIFLINYYSILPIM